MWNIAGRSGLATALMAGVLYAAVRLLPSGRLWTVLLVGIGVAAYAVFARLTGAVTQEDLAPLTRRFAKKTQKKGEERK